MKAPGWYLTRINGGEPTHLPVTQNSDGSTEPQWWEGRETLTLVYDDGRRVVYPWHALAKAEYIKPVREAVTA